MIILTGVSTAQIVWKCLLQWHRCHQHHLYQHNVFQVLKVYDDLILVLRQEHVLLVIHHLLMLHRRLHQQLLLKWVLNMFPKRKKNWKICSLLTDDSAVYSPFHNLCIRKDEVHEELVADESLDDVDMDDDDEEENALMQMRQSIQKSHTYKCKDRTREYRETNYLFQDVSISINAFWLDYLMHENNSPFLSQVSVRCASTATFLNYFLTENH
jgi:hypothetical protein